MPLSSPPASIFPFYLLPSIPFRRSSNSSAAGNLPSAQTSVAASSTPYTDSISHSYLASSQSLLRCSRCLAHICPTHSIISKGFTGRHGRAYLVAPPGSTSSFATPSIHLPRHHNPGNLPNTHTHKPVPRQLVTGAHTVSDISCAVCGAGLGWKYVSAEEEGQKYKVGMFILETMRVISFVDWENGRDPNTTQDVTVQSGGVPVSEKRKDSGVGMDIGTTEEDRIEFDSQDEDECEDLFTGIWSPSLAKKRRKTRAWREEGE